MWLKSAVAIVLAVVAAWLAFAFSESPFLWTGLAIAALLLWLMLGAKTSVTRAILLNVAVVFGTLALVEAYYWAKEPVSPKRREGDYVNAYFDKVRSPILGYQPIHDKTSVSRRFYGDRLIYDVLYTIDEHGLRVAPPAADGTGAECILFFGGSFTFGEGVNDDEAMPYRVGELVDNRQRIFNFGFHGYGPHQMLSALESGLVADIAACEASHVFYQALVSHAKRASGLALWDVNGPRYLMGADGVRRDGALYENYGLPLSVVNALKKSRAFRKIIRGRQGRIEAEHVELFLAIVDRSRDLVATTFPGAEYHVILWPPMLPSEAPAFEKIRTGADRLSIDLVEIDDVLPGIRTEEGRALYKIHRDGHPTVLAQDTIARYLVDNVIRD